MTCATTVADTMIYVIGPILICFAMVIAGCLTYTFFYVMLPMIKKSWNESPYWPLVMSMHVSYVLFILTNVMFNYFLCVMTSNKGLVYERVVREIADATGFPYPETPEEVAQCKQDFEDRMILRMERRRARRVAADEASSSNSNQTTTAVPSGAATSGNNMTQRRGGGTGAPTTSPTAPAPRGWMLMGATEWGFCRYSNQPKPPRSHYDHVTKTLVLNMDHFCPWMFNTIGYLNYRYFVNFLLYVCIGMLYGALLSVRSFLSMSFRPKAVSAVWRPERGDETAVAFSFMLCLSVGLAVACLGGFHLYLLLTAQTTIEFHGNYSNMRRAKQHGSIWKNPYDLGWKQNWRQVYGSQHWLRALLPSSREPEFLPIPISGKPIRRHSKSIEQASVTSNGHGNSGINIV
jgi:palmitoyltransferase